MSSCHPSATQQTASRLLPGVITVALAGQPNVGKSTLFNLLTGLDQHVGNWPGKTVEQRTGTHTREGTTLSIVDLPGTYSLTANSQEELIAREYIITQRPDVVAVLVDAAILERSLYLLAELMALDVPIVVGLNMLDVAREQGLIIEPHVLEAALGVPVVPMVAARNEGVRELIAKVIETAGAKQATAPSRPEILANHQAVLDQVQGMIAPAVPPRYAPAWVALKLLEGDPAVIQMIRTCLQPDRWQEVEALLQRHEDAALAIVGGRYEWVGRMTRAAVTQPPVGQITITERLDRIAVHPVGGLVVLGAILALLFFFTYSIGAPIQSWLSNTVVGGLAGLASWILAGAPAWLSGLVVDGVIGGAGTMLTFVPILAIFFAAMAVLEDVGYMARAAYVMDRFMHPMGLHGKSFLPLFLGFGCNVPSVLGTRIIEEPRARLLTVLLAPLMPCTARMAVVAFMAPVFFGRAATLVSWLLIMLSLTLVIGLGFVLSRTVVRGEPLAFIMEMPLYHKPHLRSIALLVWQRTIAFVQRAGTVILVASLVVWALAWLPNGDVETSLLASVGRLFAPLGSALGLDWKLLVALLASFVAKENAIATIGVLMAGGEGQDLAATLVSTLTPAAAAAFLVVQVLFIPCVATVATMRQELHSWRWTLFGVALLLVVSFAAGILVYQVLSAFGL